MKNINLKLYELVSDLVTSSINDDEMKKFLGRNCKLFKLELRINKKVTNIYGYSYHLNVTPNHEILHSCIFKHFETSLGWLWRLE